MKLQFYFRQPPDINTIYIKKKSSTTYTHSQKNHTEHKHTERVGLLPIHSTVKLALVNESQEAHP